MISTPPASVPMIDEGGDPASEVLNKIQEGFQLLAELHRVISRNPDDGALALEHVSTATHELAAIQKIFDRRTDR